MFFKNKYFIGMTPMIFFLFFWEYYSSLDSINQFLFSSPSRIIISLYENILNGILIRDFLITGFEVLTGFFIGNFFGIIIGISLWFSDKIAKISQPYITGIGAIPIFALAPMMIIWFGTTIFSKIMMVILSTIIIAIIQSYEGAKNVDKNQIKLLQSFGATKIQVFKKIIIPSSLVWVFNSLKISVSFAVLGAFIGEFISSDGGLGYRILSAGGLYDIALVLSSVLLLILLVFIITFFIKLFEKKIMFWKDSSFG